MSRGLTILSMLAALVLGGVVGKLATGRRASRPWCEITRDARVVRRVLPQVDSERIPVGRSPVLGSDGALVTIVEFGDFQCPYCARVEATLRQIREAYGDDVRVVWKNGPLPFHDRAMPAAEAAMEAYAQGGDAKFWAYHDLLFEHQREPDGLDRTRLEAYAQQLGLDMTRFRAALDHNAHRAALAADHRLAQRFAVGATPQFFINGRRLLGAQPIDAFARLITETRTRTEELIRTRPGTTRANVYARTVDRGHLGPVYLPHGRAHD